MVRMVQLDVDINPAEADTCVVTWAVAVIHWLTVGSIEANERALIMLVQGSVSNGSTGQAPSI